MQFWEEASPCRVISNQWTEMTEFIWFCGFEKGEASHCTGKWLLVFQLITREWQFNGMLRKLVWFMTKFKVLESIIYRWSQNSLQDFLSETLYTLLKIIKNFILLLLGIIYVSQSSQTTVHSVFLRVSSLACI